MRRSGDDQVPVWMKRPVMMHRKMLRMPSNYSSVAQVGGGRHTLEELTPFY